VLLLGLIGVVCPAVSRQPWHVLSLGAGPTRRCSSDSRVQLRPGWHGLERGCAGIARRQADFNSTAQPAHRLAVITADDQPCDWRLMQNELAALSSNSIHMIAAETTHASWLFSERDATFSTAASNSPGDYVGPCWPTTEPLGQAIGQSLNTCSEAGRPVPYRSHSQRCYRCIARRISARRCAPRRPLSRRGPPHLDQRRSFGLPAPGSGGLGTETRAQYAA